jgi:purine-binding chemotaxis protein CheW
MMGTSTQLAASGSATVQSTSQAGEVLQIVTFQVGKEIFGLDILKVHEIIRFQPLTRVPNLPDYVEGVLNLRGKIIPVVGLRQSIGLDRQEASITTKIVVASVKDEVLGFMVDSVSEVLRISSNTVDPAPRLGEVGRKYVSGVGKLDNRLLLLLDLDELLNEEEQNQVLSAKTAGEPSEA